MIGKAQNGQKLPFGPYTLPQVVGGVVLMLITSVLAMSLPSNPAITFIVGLILTIVVVFTIGLVPYTGVRATSRMLWLGRILVVRKPVSASGIPVTAESAGQTLFIEESVVVILPDHRDTAEEVAAVAAPGMGQPQSILDKWSVVAVRELPGRDELSIEG
nr:hypothetical protein [Nocardia transvalensis]